MLQYIKVYDVTFLAITRKLHRWTCGLGTSWITVVLPAVRCRLQFSLRFISWLLIPRQNRIAGNATLSSATLSVRDDDLLLYAAAETVWTFADAATRVRGSWWLYTGWHAVL
jgi:hypothetical protein